MRNLTYIFILIGLVNCNQTDTKSTSDSGGEMNMEIEEQIYGQTTDGDNVTMFTLVNSQGMTMEVLDYGGIIVSLTAPDRDGIYEDVVLGFDSLQPYVERNPFFGALVGRYGNRIGGGRFVLDGKEYSLVQNNHENHLHGGTKGFDKVIWETKALDTPEGPALEMTYTSAHMEEGYPGELSTKVTYLLGNDNSLRINYEATTDRPTIVNLTQHTYFNLNPSLENILDHEVTLNANYYLAVDEGLIPLGSIDEVKGTPFDFLEPHAVGERIDNDHPQLAIAGGYDHCWVLNGELNELKSLGVVYEPVSGREMTVKTTEPGVQFYTANFMDGSLTGKGKTYQKRGALCLETQHYPDSPNQPGFPSVRLDPADTYRSTTVFKFDAR